MTDELTDAEIARLDKVHNTIFDLEKKLIPDHKKCWGSRKLLEWDMEHIGAISDAVESYLVRYGICTEKEFAPYMEEK